MTGLFAVAHRHHAGLIGAPPGIPRPSATTGSWSAAARRLSAAAMAAVLVAGCGGTSPSTTGGPDPSFRPSSTPGTTPQAIASTSPAGEGVPDPAGRIVFGRVTRVDDFFGQVIALWAIDPDGSDLAQLTTGESSSPSWSPDGRRIAYTTRQPDGSWQVATMAADGSDIRILTSGAGIHEAPSWAPDGTWLAYDVGPAPSDQFHTVLYRMQADGSHQMLLGDPDAFDVEQRISPDGRSIAFERLTSDANGNQHNSLVVRDIASGAERTLPAAGNAVEHVAWSPDGHWLLFDVSSALTSEVPHDQVERIAADGSGQPVVVFQATSTRGGFKAVYSPDGRSILFGCLGMNGRTDEAACLMDADGSNVRILVDAPNVNENGFAWGVAAP